MRDDIDLDDVEANLARKDFKAYKAIGNGSKGWRFNQKHPVQIPQVFDREITVVIWKNSRGINKYMVPKTLLHPGHAALLLRTEKKEDMWKVFDQNKDYYFLYYINDRDAKKYRYFSFFPSLDVNVDSYVKDKRKGTKRVNTSTEQGQFNRSYIKDMSLELSDGAIKGLKEGKSSLWPGQKYLGSDEGDIIDILVEKNSAPTAANPYSVKYSESEKVQIYKHFFGAAAEDFISLRAQSACGKPHIGVNLHRLSEAARTFKNSDHFAYIMVSPKQNCAGVACRLMHAGGCTAFCSIPSIDYQPGNFLYTTPRDALKYAQATQRALTTLNAMIDELFNTYLVSGRFQLKNVAKFQTDKTNEIYTVDDWKSRSAVRRKSRGLVLIKIDKAIGEYHKYSWTGDFHKKMSAFCKIIYYVHRHSKLSRSGKRDEAFAMLVFQIISVIQIEHMFPARNELPPADYYPEIE